MKLNTPERSWRKNKKYVVRVKDTSTGKIKTIHFGQKPYRHNYSKKAWESYTARSAGIKDKNGNLTKDNKLSANYWARKVLWSGKKWKKR